MKKNPLLSETPSQRAFRNSVRDAGERGKNPLELPYRLQFSQGDDAKFTLLGLLGILSPLIAIAAVIWLVASLLK